MELPGDVMEYLPSYTDSLYLAHHGIRGQKWGVRRFQNKDGSRINKIDSKNRKRLDKARSYNELADYIESNGYPKNSFQKANDAIKASKYRKKAKKLINKIGKESMDRILDEENRDLEKRRLKAKQETELILKRFELLKNDTSNPKHPGF